MCVLERTSLIKFADAFYQLEFQTYHTNYVCYGILLITLDAFVY